MLNRHILLHRSRLLRDELPFTQRRQIYRAAAVGTVPYLTAFGLAFVSAYVTLAICAAVALYYSLPVASFRALVR